jgi:EAL domain-containing protein (putative c-di-GMP-specific phosphodiesterase class I)
MLSKTQRSYVLVIDDDSAITAALAMLLDRDGRTVILCSDVESAELVLARHPVTHVLSDVQFSGSFGFEGLHFLARIRAQRPDCRIVLMTGHLSHDLEGVAVRFGASAVLAKPFALRELEAALRLDEDTAGGPYETLRVPPLDEVMRDGLLTTEFQPIVTADHDIFGFEALTRVRGEWAGGGAAELFDYASKLQRLPELNLAALESAVAQARMLAKGAALFLNTDPIAFDRGQVVSVLRGAASRNKLPLSRIVLEITERSGFADDATALGAFDELRAEGVRFALDDHGSAYSHLSLIDRIRPSFIKISHTFGTAFDEDPMRTRVVRHIVALARDFGCRTILEGVETESTARAATAYGIDLVQGYYFGRPREASHWIDATRVAA